MIRATSSLRLAVLSSASLLLAACSGSTDFSISETFNPNTTANVQYNLTAAVDMAADAPTAWKHRDKVKSLDLVELTGVVTAGAPPAFTGSGSIKLRPDGGTGSTDVVAGSWTNETVSGVPHTLNVVLSQAAVDVVEQALKGNGKFSVLLQGTTTTSVRFTVDVTLHLKLNYKIP
jgi:hypothetical protein